MLWFVGLGISGFKSIPNEAIDVLAKADIVYLEQFTSPISKSDLTKIKKATKGEFRPAKRWLVEDGNEILENAKKKKVVLSLPPRAERSIWPYGASLLNASDCQSVSQGCPVPVQG